MSQSFGKLLESVYRELGDLVVSRATGGSTTTVTDTTIADRYDNDEFGSSEIGWGAVFLLRDAGGAGAAPEGEFSRISAFNESTAEFTIDTMTAAVASGDRYGATRGRISLDKMVELCNEGLRDLGLLELVDTTTLDTVSAQTEYACSAAWKYKVLGVDLQTNINDANDNRWHSLPYGYWDYIPAAGGSAGLIVLKDQPTESRDIRVWYLAQHPELNDYDDTVDEQVNPQLAKWACVSSAARHLVNETQGTESWAIQKLNDANARTEMLRREFPLKALRKRGAKLFKLPVAFQR
jgi:hypothetical protein